MRLQKNIFAWYFLPQFIPGFVRKVVVLDILLDNAIPFDSRYLACYLDFINLWMGSLGCLYDSYGRRAIPEMIQYLDGFESLFGNAKKVYEKCGSTVTRPGVRFSFRSLLIHITDRNRYCFPSLHVMIVCYNFETIAQILGRLEKDENQTANITLMEEKALRIVESIIHVKQHSLIDIPAGLFLLTAIGKGLGQKRDLEFLEKLFGDNSAVERLRLFLKVAYLHFIQAWDEKQDPTTILVNFLENYPCEIQKLIEDSLPSDKFSVL